MIPLSHPPLLVNGAVYDLAHLTGFSAAFAGKGKVAGTDLEISVRFSNHVVTKRAAHGQAFHAVDQHGTKRCFDLLRYDMSLQLPQAIRDLITANGLSYVSQSYGGVKNLISLRAADSKVWAIVFCFYPDLNGLSVQMHILSAHLKVVDPRNIVRKNLSYFARECLFAQQRIPKQRPSRS